MTLVISKGIRLVNINNGITDPDAIIYINNVEKADGQNLEYGVAKAFNDFVVGCKADGIWNAIKACCILAGARTLSGALVPLVGTAPVASSPAPTYGRKTGVAQSTLSFVDTRRANNADPQNSKHACAYLLTHTNTSVFMNAGGSNSTGELSLGFFGNTFYATANAANWTSTGITNTNFSNSFVGISRSSPTQFIARAKGANATIAKNSETPDSTRIRAAGSYWFASAGPNLAFYSIGESLDLALLDARVTALVNAIGAAIP